MTFVPEDFEPPRRLLLPEMLLEPLTAAHNERDHAAWSSSMEHIRSTPGFESWSWPHEMTLDQNLADLDVPRSRLRTAPRLHVHGARPGH